MSDEKKAEAKFRPHKGQVPIVKSATRFRDVCCGRRWGKTFLLASECLSAACRKYKHGKRPRVWLVAPTYSLAAECFSGSDGIETLGSSVIEKLNRTERKVTVKGGGIIEVRSAERWDRLRGSGLDFLGIDEAAFISERAWFVLRPTVSDRIGRVLRCSTPNGENWWYRMWQKGQRESPLYQRGYKSWQMPSNTNPYFPSSEWDAVLAELPESVFRREYMADFTASGVSSAGGFKREVGYGMDLDVSPPFFRVNGVAVPCYVGKSNVVWEREPGPGGGA